jgi:PPOX class probable F420-dependent enzyme
MRINDEVRSALTAGRPAHFTTLNADGSPHTVLVWVGVDGDQVVIGKLGEDKKVRNIRRDPRVSFSMEAAGDSNGLGHYLVVEGTAEIDPTGGRELLAELSQTYIGPNTDFPPAMPEGTPELVIRITPGKIRGMGPWGS